MRRYNYPMADIRIGLLGPRRARQGLGPYLGRFADEAGATLAACAGRNPDRIELSAEQLGAAVGHEVKAYVGLESMIDAEARRGQALDAIIIASPTESHVASRRVGS